jgi:3',5'-cyclic AMP phosphodiesterase CpdA
MVLTEEGILDGRMWKEHFFPWGLFVSVVFICTACTGKTAPPAKEGGAELPRALIYVTNDVHYLAENLHDRGPLYQRVIASQGGKNIDAQEGILGGFRFSVERERPDIVLLNGDLTYNGERESHAALARYLGELEQSGARVYVIPGNHDINNPLARSFFKGHARYTKPVSPREFERIYRNFGYAEAISRDRGTLSYVAEPLRGLRLLMLDSNKYRRNRTLRYPEVSGAIPRSTRNWIRRVAARAKKDGALLAAAMHHSLMDHHPMIHEGFTIDDAPALQELFSELGITFVLTGHIHAQEISQRQMASGEEVYDIATSALSVYPHQHGVLRLLPGEGRWHYTVQAPEVEAWARTAGIGDERFLRFDRYAEQFFKQDSGDMLKQQPELAFLDPDELRALGELVGVLNARYFAGTTDRNGQDIFQSEGLALLETYRFDFLYDYVQTIIKGTPPPDTELSISLTPPMLPGH